jgi:hypothetical protein
VEFDIEKEDDNSRELPLQKLRPAYSLLGPISKVPRPQSTSTKDSSALPIRATLTLWQAFNLLQILF